MAQHEETMYHILNEIYHFIRCYEVRSITLPAVCRKVIQYMREGCYDAEVTDDKHRDRKVICVDGHHFRIVRYPGWTSYDVEPID